MFSEHFLSLQKIGEFLTGFLGPCSCLRAEMETGRCLHVNERLEEGSSTQVSDSSVIPQVQKKFFSADTEHQPLVMI